MRKKTTIVDIAEKLGLSVSTVSRALKDDYQISDKTKKLVLAAARELHYVPNKFAANLSSRKSNVIGVIVPSIATHFCSTVISSIEETCLKNNYQLSIFQSNESLEREKSLVDMIINSGLDGVLISVSGETKDDSHLNKLIEFGVPLVLFDRVIESCPVSKVMVDNKAGAFSAVNHLIQQGYKKIAYIAGPDSVNIGTHRTEGYFEAHRKYNLQPDPELVVQAQFMGNSINKAANYLLKHPQKPDAIFTSASPLRVYMEAETLGIAIPEEIAVAGFTDDPTITITKPKITSVIQPIKEIGREAALLLIKEIAQKNEKPIRKNLWFKAKLEIRESTPKKS